MSSVCETIKSLRKKKKLTQEAVAKKIGISRVWYNKIERDEVDIKIDLLNKLALIFDVPLSSIMKDTTEITHEPQPLSKSNESELYQEIIKHKDILIQEKNKVIQDLEVLLKITLINQI